MSDNKDWKAENRGRLSRRDFLKASGLATAGIVAGDTVAGAAPGPVSAPRSRMNLIIFTTDDNDAESLGCYACPLEGVTPNLDRLAAGGLRFEHAHTVVSTCQGSRLSLMSGRYPQTNGNTGHDYPLRDGVTTLALELKNAGYYTGLVQKDPNYKPYEAFQWDRHGLNTALMNDVRDRDRYWPGWGVPENFYDITKQLLSDANASRKPFFLHLNTTDPHRPWPGSVDEVTFLSNLERLLKIKARPMRPFARNFSPFEVPVPGYLPDLPGVRVDVAQYYSAMHNADAAFGRVMDALDEAGLTDNTVLVYLGDQGASLPTSKQNLYRYSTRIPLIIRWPRVTEPGRSVTDTMVSIIDLMPTLLDGLGVDGADGIDGNSLWDLLLGKTTRARDWVHTSYNFAKPGVQVFPMRAVQSKELLYIYNGWVGERNIKPPVHLVYDGRIDPLTGLSWISMKNAALRDSRIKHRVEFIRRRVPEEIYDLREDPYCLSNRIEDAALEARIGEIRQMVAAQMESTNDELLAKFRGDGPIPAEWLTSRPVGAV